MEIENKLDEDFIFYLGFVNSFLRHIRDKDTAHRCEQWLQKLCGEPCRGAERKRCRNIYLSHLLLCMQSGQLSSVFRTPLNEVDIGNAEEVFDLSGKDLEKPDWLFEKDVIPKPEQDLVPKKGRTYLATRTLPGGQGAFAYIAVSLEDEEPKWLGGGEGIFDQHMEQKYKEEVPDYEMEKILARRKDPKEREKVVTFYTILLDNIEDELDGKIAPRQNPTINGLIEQLEQDLKDRAHFGPYEGLDDEAKRVELMLLLHDRIKTRINKVIKREELLDEIEKSVVSKSFFDTSIVDDDKFQLPAAMWEQVINKAPNRKQIATLRETYPQFLVEKFLKLLSDHKEEIAMRMQKRHENIAAQMKKELRREDEKGKKLIDGAQTACDHAIAIYKDVKAAYDRQQDRIKLNKEKEKMPLSRHSKIYEQMRAALYDTHKSVEDEASRGRALAAEIYIVNEQSEMCAKTTEQNIRKIEEKNMALMTNIKRLNTLIKQQQHRIKKVQATGKGEDDDEVFFDV